MLFFLHVDTIKLIQLGGSYMDSNQLLKSEIKKQNRTKIFQLIRDMDAVSKQDIVYQLKLSLPTITQNLTSLMEDGVIEESGYVGNTGGRSARTYSMVKDAATAIGLDLTQHHITAVCIDLVGTVLYKIRKRIDFERSDSYYKKINDIILQLISESQIDTNHILGVGLGIPGLVSDDHKSVFYGRVMDLTDITIDELGKYISYPCSIQHDSAAAGFAEIWINPSTENAFYFLINNSIGGSFIYKDQVYAGNHNHSAEIGHVKIIPNGRQCYCGGSGCVDPYCSAKNLSDLTDGNLEQFFIILKEGDAQAHAVWEDYLQYLAMAIHNTSMLLDCPIILGGYVGQYLDPYISDIKQLVSKLDPFGDGSELIRPCYFKNEAVAVGAALTYIDAFLNSI